MGFNLFLQNIEYNLGSCLVTSHSKNTKRGQNILDELCENSLDLRFPCSRVTWDVTTESTGGIFKITQVCNKLNNLIIRKLQSEFKLHVFSFSNESGITVRVNLSEFTLLLIRQLRLYLFELFLDICSVSFELFKTNLLIFVFIKEW